MFHDPNCTECPVCKSHLVEEVSSEIDYDDAFSYWECQTCGSEWYFQAEVKVTFDMTPEVTFKGDLDEDKLEELTEDVKRFYRVNHKLFEMYGTEKPSSIADYWLAGGGG